MVFSGNGHPPEDNPPSGPQKKPFLLGTPWGEALVLALFAAVITLYGLGATSLIDNDETRFGLLARNMIETGDWVVPRWSHRPQGTKPPLFMWAVAGFSSLTGEINSWSARGPSALAGVGVVVLTYFFGRRFFPHPVPFLAGLVMSTNVAFYQIARTARTDMLLVFFVLLAATLVLEGQARGGGGRGFLLVMGGYAAAGLAVLTKGPVGFLLPGFIVGGVWVARREWKRASIAAHLAGLAVMVGVAGSWYFLFQDAIGGESARGFVLRENLLRFLSAFDHSAPFYYFVYTFAGDFMPWTPIFILALAWAWVRRKAKTADYGAVLIWFAAVFVFFSVSSSKRGPYVFALYPAAAMMTGAFLATAMAPVGKSLDRWRTAGVWTFRGLGVAAVGLAVGGSIWTAMRFPSFLIPAIAAAVLLCVFGAWMLRETFRGTLGRVTLVIPTGFLMIHLLVQPLAAPHLERRKSPRPYAKEVADLVGRHHLVSYKFSKASLDFYAPPEMGEVYFIYDWGMLRYFFRYHQEPVYVVMSRKNYQAIRPEALAGSRLLRENLKYRKESLVVLTNRPARPDRSARVNGAAPPARANRKDPAGRR